MESDTFMFAIEQFVKVLAPTLAVVLTYFLGKKVKKSRKAKNRAIKESKLVTDSALSLTVLGRKSNAGVFIGRKDDISKILDMLKSCSIICISGPPGIGKSTIAKVLKSNAKVISIFPNNVLFSNMEVERTIDGVCNKIMEHFDSKVIAGGISSEAQVLRKMKDYKHTLYLLDNCEQISDDVLQKTINYWSESIPNNYNISFIFTSRNKHHKIGKRYELKPLNLPSDRNDRTSDSTIALIKKIQAQPVMFLLKEEHYPLLFDIVIKTEGIPWIIDLVAGKINYLSLENIKVSISDIPNGDIFKFFDKSYREIDKTSQSVFDQLSLFQGGFTEDAYKSVIDIGDSKKPKMEILSNLSNYSFVYFDHEDKKYRLYVHIRQIGEKLLEKWPATEYKTLKIRMANYFNSLLIEESKKIESSQSSIVNNALDVMHQDLDNVFMAHEIFIDYADHEKAAKTAILFDEVLLARGPATKRIERLKLSYASLPVNETEIRVTLSMALSKALWSSGDWMRAESYAKISVYNSKPDTLQFALSGQRLAKIFKDRGFLHEALRIYEENEPLIISHLSISSYDRNQFYSELGNCLDQLGQLSKALAKIDEIDSGVQNISAANMHNRKGLAYWHHGNSLLSLQEINKAIELSKQLHHVARTAAYTTNKALVLIDSGQYSEASRVFNNNEETHNKTGHKQWLAVNFAGKGRLLLRRNKTGDLENAKRQIRSAIELSESVGYFENLAWHYGDLGRIYLMQSEYTSAIDNVKKGISLQRRMGATKSVRHFSNQITHLIALFKINAVPNSINHIEALYASIYLYLSYIKKLNHQLPKHIEEDIFQLSKLSKNVLQNDLSNLDFKNMTLLFSSHFSDFEHCFSSLLLLNSLDEGSYEYHRDEDINWKHFKVEENVEIFIYGLLINPNYRLEINSTKCKLVFGEGINLEYNHIPPLNNDYNGFIVPQNSTMANINYSGYIMDKVPGIVMTLTREELRILSKAEKGYALIPISCRSMANSDVFKAYSLTSKDRLFNGKKLTSPSENPSMEYLEICRKGALSHGEDFYSEWYKINEQYFK